MENYWCGLKGRLVKLNGLKRDRIRVEDEIVYGVGIKEVGIGLGIVR